LGLAAGPGPSLDVAIFAIVEKAAQRRLGEIRDSPSAALEKLIMWTKETLNQAGGEH